MSSKFTALKSHCALPIEKIMKKKVYDTKKFMISLPNLNLL